MCRCTSTPRRKRSKPSSQALGFTVDEEGGEIGRSQHPSPRCEWTSSLRFAMGRTIQQRRHWNSNGPIVRTPRTAPVGCRPDQVVNLFNRVLDVFQLPRDWRIKASLNPCSNRERGQPQEQPASQEWVVNRSPHSPSRCPKPCSKAKPPKSKPLRGIMTTVSEQLQPAMEALEEAHATNPAQLAINFPSSVKP